MRSNRSSADNTGRIPSSSTWRRASPWIATIGMGILACVLGYLAFKQHARVTAR